MVEITTAELKEGQKKMQEQMETFATKEDLNALAEKMATKADVQMVADSIAELLTLFKNFKIGIHVGGRIFGVSGKFIMYVSGFIVAIAAMTGPLKGLLVWLGIDWLFHLRS